MNQILGYIFLIFSFGIIGFGITIMSKKRFIMKYTNYMVIMLLAYIGMVIKNLFYYDLNKNLIKYGIIALFLVLIYYVRNRYCLYNTNLKTLNKQLTADLKKDKIKFKSTKNYGNSKRLESIYKLENMGVAVLRKHRNSVDIEFKNFSREDKRVFLDNVRKASVKDKNEYLSYDGLIYIAVGLMCSVVYILELIKTV